MMCAAGSFCSRRRRKSNIHRRERTSVHGTDTEVELQGVADIGFMSPLRSHNQDAIGVPGIMHRHGWFL
ncbi:hypothetical protein APY04_0497 [Hyphomicrobium sulfonivorans]|uniref:Uncharacterized protein n=1 Tax=Hyphomicrobium sulfonivorans TaxID=121290 RepID=A0A125NVZ6_HYPSL|nr:hypothetical protein APY04_0497 [Hyphomicrobium sulfonivorans]